MPFSRKGCLLKAMQGTKRDIDELARALTHVKSKREIFAQLGENTKKGCKQLRRALRRLERGIDGSGPLDTTALDDMMDSWGAIHDKLRHARDLVKLQADSKGLEEQLRKQSAMLSMFRKGVDAVMESRKRRMAEDPVAERARRKRNRSKSSYSSEAGEIVHC